MYGNVYRNEFSNFNPGVIILVAAVNEFGDISGYNFNAKSCHDNLYLPNLVLHRHLFIYS